MDTTVTGEFGTLREEVEMIDVSSALPRPDKAWRYTDAAGHQHRWRGGWPTLEWFVTERYWCEECHDEHTQGEWICPLCDEVITPGMTGPSMFKERIPGMTSYYLNDEPISESRYRELVAQLNR